MKTGDFRPQNLVRFVVKIYLNRSLENLPILSEKLTSLITFI